LYRLQQAFELSVANEARVFSFPTEKSNWNVDYNLWSLNNADRANSLNFRYSTDDVTYTQVAALDFTTPEVSDASGWQSSPRSTTINATVPNGGSLYRIPPANVSNDAGNRLARIQLSQPFAADKLSLQLFADTIADSLGNSLDGNHDDTGGDDFSLSFAVLPGDAASNGAVTAVDLSKIRSGTGQIQGVGGTDRQRIVAGC
jgi:hypothetical protein